MRPDHLQYFARAAATLAFLWIAHRLGVTARLQRWIARRTTRGWVQAIAIAAPFFAVMAVLQPRLLVPGAFFAIAALLSRRAWLPLWAAGVMLIAVSAFVLPFHERADTRSLDQETSWRLAAIAKHADVAISMGDVRVAQAHPIDGYTIGAGPGCTVILTSGAIAQLAPDELAFLFGHELGHYHLVTRYDDLVLVGCALALLLLVLGLRRVSSRIDIHKIPVVLLVVLAAQLAGDPVRALVQREIEQAADEFGVRAIEGLVPEARQAAARALARMAASFGPRPEPSFFDILCGVDHPPIDERIDHVLHF